MEILKGKYRLHRLSSYLPQKNNKKHHNYIILYIHCTSYVHHQCTVHILTIKSTIFAGEVINSQALVGFKCYGEAHLRHITLTFNSPIDGDFTSWFLLRKKTTLFYYTCTGTLPSIIWAHENILLTITCHIGASNRSPHQWAFHTKHLLLFVNKRPLGLRAPLSNNTLSMIRSPMNTK